MMAARRSCWVGALALALPATSNVYPVPSVDMSLLDSGSEAEAAAARASIVAACETSGLFRAADSRMTEQLVADSLKAHSDVFALPMESKLSVRFDQLSFEAAPGFTRGYVPLGGESGSAERLECKEVGRSQASRAVPSQPPAHYLRRHRAGLLVRVGVAAALAAFERAPGSQRMAGRPRRRAARGHGAMVQRVGRAGGDGGAKPCRGGAAVAS